MAVDVPTFAAAIDKVYQDVSSQPVVADRDVRLGERGKLQYMEQKFQQKLQRARAAFLQEFRNHAVVVENEVRKIREQLTATLEEKYGEKIASLREQAAEAVGLVQKHRDEIAQLKKLAAAQETYLAAVRHRWGVQDKERLMAEVQRLLKELDEAKTESAELSHQLLCRDELVAQLGSELSALEETLQKQASASEQERHRLEDQLRELREEMQTQQEVFREHLSLYEERFMEYRAKTTAELEIQDILNNRRAEALALMEEERQRHIRARTKPTSRIGPVEEERFQPYELAKSTRYRVDDMGMDTSWRGYQLSDVHLGPPARKAPPKFNVERIRKVVPAPGRDPGSDTARQGGAEMRLLEPDANSVPTTSRR